MHTLMGISVLITTYMTDSVLFHSCPYNAHTHTRSHKHIRSIYAKWKLYRRSSISMSKSQKMETKGIIYTMFFSTFFILFFKFSKPNDENHFNMNMSVQRKKAKRCNLLKFIIKRNMQRYGLQLEIQTERIPIAVSLCVAVIHFLRLLLRLPRCQCLVPVPVHVNLLK